MIRTFRVPVFASALSLLLLTGCAMNNAALAPTDVEATGLSGQVLGGNVPVVGATIEVVEAGTTGYGSAATVLATTMTVAGGVFTFAAVPYTCPVAGTPVYLLAIGGNTGSGTNTNAVMAASLGDCSTGKTSYTYIDEVTTAATAFALAHFFTPTLGSTSTDSFGGPSTGTAGTYYLGLVNANKYTVPSLVSLTTGQAKTSTTTTTIESAKINSIADVIAYCVNTTGETSTTETTTACGKLFAATTPPGATTRPYDTLQAAVQMALYPYQNVSTLFGYAAATGAPFIGLSTAPNDWTIGVSYTTTTLGLGIAATDSASATSANIDIDATGRIWVPSNKTGAIGVGYFDPTAGTFSGPYNGVTGGVTVTAPQYLAIDQSGIVWVTDQAGANIVGISTTAPAGATKSAAFASTKGGPITVDYDNTLFFTLDFQTQAYLGELDPTRTNLTSPDNFTNTPTSLNATYVDSTGTNRIMTAMTNGLSTTCNLEAETEITGTWFFGDYASGTPTPCASGGSSLTALNNDVIGASTTDSTLCSGDNGTCVAPTVPLNKPEGVATDGVGNIWVANSADGSVSTLGISTNTSTFVTTYVTTSTVEYKHNSTNGATMTTPYGLAIDNAGNVWVANASCVTTTTTLCTSTGLTLSELIGAAAPTITPLSEQLAGQTAGTEPTLAHGGSGVGSKSGAMATKKALQKARTVPLQVLKLSTY